jgi:CubicO group peptidase (beta-lactamase class C family)
MPPPIRPLATALLIVSGRALTAKAEDPAPKFHDYMKACVEVNHFSGAVLVSKGGKTLFGKGYGFANIEYQVPNTTRTKFRLGSITKQFTAMAILILQERGKLKVEDPVGKYIDGAPKAWDGVTIHHLLL